VKLIFLLGFPLAFLALYSAQVGLEWFRIRLRSALADYEAHFQRVENLFPPFKL
jgi:hypothetical protein